MWTVYLDSAAETQALGAALGRVLDGPASVALVGDLGAGKTCLAQGIGAGLGVELPVVSPTFVIIAEYPGRVGLLHADAYRLQASELPGVGLEEAIEDWEGVAVLEWADRFPALMPADHLRIELHHEAAGRRLEATALGALHEALLERWKSEAGLG
jgi:tRNA threonylcarbamoyladenosine biosynthesis protein TsaE